MLLEKLTTLWSQITGNIGFAIIFVVGIIAFAILYFYLMKFLYNNNSSHVISFVVLLFIIIAGVFIGLMATDSEVNGAIFLIVPAMLILMLFCLYSTEIKRVIWTRRNMKMVDMKHGEDDLVNEEEVSHCIAEIIKAVQDMSKNDVGAIIVLSNGNVPSKILDSGVGINSTISSELIESIFFPKTPLHDGAMIINGTEIVAAGCFLPLSQKENIPKELGTRHRAGLGITEMLDVMTIIVSEETGIISIAKTGQITRYADSEMLKKVLNEYYWKELYSSKK